MVAIKKIALQNDISIESLLIRKDVTEMIDEHLLAFLVELDRWLGGWHHICVAGGFASYLAGVTTKYGDIDIFVHKSSYLVSRLRQFLRRKFPAINAEELLGSDNYGGSSSYVEFGAFKLNFTVKSFKTVRHLVDKFDLSACRSFLEITDGGRVYANSLTLEEGQLYLDEVFKLNIDRERGIRYADRLKVLPLQLLCIAEYFKK